MACPSDLAHSTGGTNAEATVETICMVFVVASTITTMSDTMSSYEYALGAAHLWYHVQQQQQQQRRRLRKDGGRAGVLVCARRRQASQVKAFLAPMTALSSTVLRSIKLGGWVILLFNNTSLVALMHTS